MQDENSIINEAVRFVNWIKKATSRLKEDYFQLPIASKPDRIFRERVYCYELYHQLRCLMEGNTSYSLGGEVDKSAHPMIQEDGIMNTVPDLLIHKPGYMEGNLVIIEVKPIKADIGNIYNDIRKISTYISNANYVKGVMLLYGDDKPKVLEVASNFPKSIDNLSKISLLWHQSVGHEAQDIIWKS